MTLVLAWVDGGSAFLAADTAVTFKGSPRESHSSFGELQVNGTYAVEERLPKLLRLSATVMCGIAGDVRRARAFVELIREDLASGKSLNEALAGVGPIFRAEGDSFRVVFAYVDSDVVELCLFSSEVGLSAVDTSCVIGSVPEALERTVLDRLGQVLRLNLDPHDPRLPLAAMLAHLQAIGISTWLPEHSIGGVFLGAYVSPAGGAAWQDPITYVIHPPEFPLGHFKLLDPARPLEMVHCEVHIDSAVITSTLLPQVKILPSPWGPPTWDGWLAELRKTYPDDRIVTPDARTPFFIFLNRTGRKAVVLKRRPNSEFPVMVKGVSLLLSDVFVEHLRIHDGQEFHCALVTADD
jgi:hypothetical protein